MVSDVRVFVNHSDLVITLSDTPQQLFTDREPYSFRLTGIRSPLAGQTGRVLELYACGHI